MREKDGWENIFLEDKLPKTQRMESAAPLGNHSATVVIIVRTDAI